MRTVKTLGLKMALLLAIGCAGRQGPQGAETMKQGAAVTAKVVEVSYQRPPLVELVVDVQLRNEEAEPRWFVLPTRLPARSEGGVNVLEVSECTGQGRALLGRFLGRGGLYALLLPAGGEVHLPRLAIEHWGDPPALLHLEAKIASDLVIGGEAARVWFGAEPASEAKVDATKVERASVHRTPDDKEVPISLVGAHAASVELAVPQR